MGEIGGYIELDRYTLPMLHEGAVALNCGINALAYLIRARGIKRLQVPRFLCSSVRNVCQRERIECTYYSVTGRFLPSETELEDDEWLYLVNYYGQLSDKQILTYKRKYPRLILDNVQAYFQAPVPGVDTIYSCRKFFGVPDGAFLYTDARLNRVLPQDVSYDRMRHLLGRYEKTASEFYPDFLANEKRFGSVPLRRMSKLTENLLRGIDYAQAKQKRTENFRCLHAALAERNKLRLTVPEGPFMYPFWTDNGAALHKELQKQKIYIPTLWPGTLDLCTEDMPEYDMTVNILPLPCDQRYGQNEMNWMIEKLLDLIEHKNR